MDHESEKKKDQAHKEVNELKKKADTPESIKSHSDDYEDKSWKRYELNELGSFVHLLVKRSSHRINQKKKAKDLYDAYNYWRMMEARIEEMMANSSNECKHEIARLLAE